jgi:hypothetical protein
MNHLRKLTLTSKVSKVNDALIAVCEKYSITDKVTQQKLIIDIITAFSEA